MLSQREAAVHAQHQYCSVEMQFARYIHAILHPSQASVHQQLINIWP